MNLQNNDSCIKGRQRETNAIVSHYIINNNSHTLNDTFIMNSNTRLSHSEHFFLTKIIKAIRTNRVHMAIKIMVSRWGKRFQVVSLQNSMLQI